MKSTDDCCSPDEINEFLTGCLSDARQRAMEAHLETCGQCRERLERTAADPDSWSEAGEYLCDVEEAEDLDVEPSLSVLIRSVLDSLRPTDDPEMLGRLGSYEVSGVIGSGGMGIVLKAVDRSLDRTVAIKVLSPQLASSGAARQRFEREAKAAAAVLHPNVIAIHGVSTDSALPYLVMPYLRGMTLQRRIDREGALPLADILRIGSQIASGLAAAHLQGLVHRDIKPANILLEEGVERVAITDFGLARAVDDASVTKTGFIAGTPQYMSPEQATGEGIDHRTDLFSLGSVLYALCTGRAPFRAETTFGVLRRITDGRPRPIRESNPAIPEWLCQLIGSLHEKSADKRYQSADEVATLLQACLAHVQNANVPLPSSLRVSKPFSLSRAVMMVCAGIVLSAVALLALPSRDATDAMSKSDARSVVQENFDEEEISLQIPWDDGLQREVDELLTLSTELEHQSGYPFAGGSKWDDDWTNKPASIDEELDHDE